MVGIAPGFEELGITGYTADIFRRTGSGTIDAGRIFAGWIGRDARFELDPMPPVVAEVVQIEEPDGLGVRPLEVAQPDQGGFEYLGVVFEILLEALIGRSRCAARSSNGTGVAFWLPRSSQPTASTSAQLVSEVLAYRRYSMGYVAVEARKPGAGPEPWT